ncbi:(2Fe-2S)-binding protein [Aquincola tertiaricarbonis]|uniref:(2Fe-2S)-binding protein n=1 Tax=Aquincola tertiaricarbonis TaxID=391953 RepID=A0ABY4S541_AQUTE|nr:(2Fe-2S)-binding protein [Aquincola tertiaricarbonis]URI08551.1 (2Fe-2S)-binding protein [Aquincola tertiaricarbonis]
MARLNINGQVRTVDVEEDTPLLWVLRDHVGLTGAKYGCGIAQCGACTVHVDGAAVRCCVMPVSAIEPTQKIVTIEGLGQPGRPHPLQQAWAELDVAQCGYCQAGMLMAASALLARNPNPSEEDIRSEIGNICRCGTYGRVLQGIQLAARRMAAGASAAPAAADVATAAGR